MPNEALFVSPENLPVEFLTPAASAGAEGDFERDAIQRQMALDRQSYADYIRRHKEEMAQMKRNRKMSAIATGVGLAAGGLGAALGASPTMLRGITAGSSLIGRTSPAVGPLSEALGGALAKRKADEQYGAVMGGTGDVNPWDESYVYNGGSSW